jgi:hypothetical protein
MVLGVAEASATRDYARELLCEPGFEFEHERLALLLADGTPLIGAPLADRLLDRISFYGLPWVTGMMGLENVAGPTVQQACATSARVLQMAALEVMSGIAACALAITADRMSNGPIVYYPDPAAPGGQGISESWTLDNFADDPHAGNAMVDTAENVARRYQISTEQQHAVMSAVGSKTRTPLCRLNSACVSCGRRSPIFLAEEYAIITADDGDSNCAGSVRARLITAWLQVRVLPGSPVRTEVSQCLTNRPRFAGLSASSAVLVRDSSEPLHRGRLGRW